MFKVERVPLNKGVSLSAILSSLFFAEAPQPSLQCGMDCSSSSTYGYFVLYHRERKISPARREREERKIFRFASTLLLLVLVGSNRYCSEMARYVVLKYNFHLVITIS